MFFSLGNESFNWKSKEKKHIAQKLVYIFSHLYVWFPRGKKNSVDLLVHLHQMRDGMKINRKKAKLVIDNVFSIDNIQHTHYDNNSSTEKNVAVVSKFGH